MPAYKLYYFNSRGRAELSRWIFEVGGMDYEDVRLTKEEWAEKKPNTPFGQIPVLEIDGVQLAQGNSIARYLAKKAGLCGRDDLEAARADMMVDCIEDMVKPLMPVFFAKTPEEKLAALKTWQEEHKSKYLGYFEKFLADNTTKSGVLVGEELSWADLALVNALSWLDMADKIDFDQYPLLKALKSRVLGHPKIADWISRRPATEH